MYLKILLVHVILLGQYSLAVKVQSSVHNLNERQNNLIAEQWRDSESMIHTSKYDHRSYRNVVLPNNLQVFLISDPQSVKAAAAMDVGNGYFNDPDDSPGLTHFIEHVLFPGTEKHMERTEFNKYLKKHGGTSDAYTGMENINFFFSVNAPFLRSCLKLFSQYFIKPILTQSAMKQGLKSINNEYKKNSDDDDSRFFRLQSHLAASSSPFHKIGTGNFKTLGHMKFSEMQQRFIDHLSKYFNTNNLRLVVLGKESLDTLESYVRTIFGVINQPAKNKTISSVGEKSKPNKPTFSQKVKKQEILQAMSSTIPSLSSSSIVYSSKILGSLVFLKTVKDLKKMVLVWPIPSQIREYRAKNLDFIAKLLGNHAQGSLHHVLKQIGWANSLETGRDDTANTLFHTLSINIKLSDQGMSHINDIIQLVYNYINLIKNEGIQEWRYKELAKSSQLAFDHKSKEDPLSYVSALSSNMRFVRPQDILSAGYLFSEFQPMKIMSIMNLLTPDNMLVYILQKDTKLPLPFVEPWYGTHFAIKPISALEKQHYLQSAHSVLQSYSQTLRLPGPNPFFPIDLSIKPPYVLQTSDTTTKNIVSHFEHPSIIMEKTHPPVRVWFYQDTTFKMPHAHLNAKFWSSILHSTPSKSVLTKLYVVFFNDVLETLDDVNRKSFSHSFHETPTGLELQIRGYNDGLGLYAIEIFKKLNRVPKFSKQRFENVKQNILNSYYSKQYQKPSKYVCQLVAAVLHSKKFSMQELVKSLISTHLDDILHFHKLLFSDVQLELFFHGNLLPTKALAISNSIVNIFKYGASKNHLDHFKIGHPRLAKLPEGKHIFLKMQHPNLKEKNSVSYTYYQYGQGTDLDGVYELLLTLMTSNSTHGMLQTIEEPGDVVASFDETMLGVPGFAVLLMSPHVDSMQLNKRINSMILNLQQYLHDITTEKGSSDFHLFIDTLRNKLQKGFGNLQEKTNNFWSEIKSGQLRFNRRKVYDSILNNSSKFIRDGFRIFVDRMFGKKSSYLSINIDSGGKINGKKKNIGSTLSSLKKNMDSVLSIPADKKNYSSVMSTTGIYLALDQKVSVVFSSNPVYPSLLSSSNKFINPSTPVATTSNGATKSVNTVPEITIQTSVTKLGPLFSTRLTRFPSELPKEPLPITLVALKSFPRISIAPKSGQQLMDEKFPAKILSVDSNQFSPIGDLKTMTDTHVTGVVPNRLLKVDQKDVVMPTMGGEATLNTSSRQMIYLVIILVLILLILILGALFCEINKRQVQTKFESREHENEVDGWGGKRPSPPTHSRPTRHSDEKNSNQEKNDDLKAIEIHKNNNSMEQKGNIPDGDKGIKEAARV